MLCLTALASCSVRPGVRSEDWDRGAIDNRTAAREAQVPLPPYPQEADLIEFFPGYTGSHRYFVDGRHLVVAADGVLRYSVVIKTTGGATNVVYEGLSCKTYEKRIYAVGQPGAKWAEAKRSEWEPIRTGRINEYQAILYRRYFCPDRAAVKDRDAAVRALRQAQYEYSPPERM